MSLYLQKTLSSPEESVSKTLELLKQNVIYLQKERYSTNEKGKSLLEVKPALLESINKSTINKFRILSSSMKPLQNLQVSTFKTDINAKIPINLSDFLTSMNLNTGQGEKHNGQSLNYSRKILYKCKLSPVVAED